MTGISVNILRSDLGDCTNKGVTSPTISKGRIVVLFDYAIKHGNYRLEDCKDDPRFICLKVVRRFLGRDGEYLHVEPIHDRGPGGPMAGGNYIMTSDSRFDDVASYPLSVHDRFETRA